MLTTEGGVRCRDGSLVVQIDAPTGTFKQVFAANRLGCALGPDDRVVCWGEPPSEAMLTPPEVSLRGVSLAAGTGCGFGPAGEILCWGDDYQGRNTPDRMDYTAFYLGGSYCGIYDEGRVGCWYTLTSPPGAASRFGEGFVQVASAYSIICALHMDGHVECQGRNGPVWQPGTGDGAIPEGVVFEEIAMGDSWGCGIAKQSRRVHCWGGSTTPADVIAVAREDLP